MRVKTFAGLAAIVFIVMCMLHLSQMSVSNGISSSMDVMHKYARNVEVIGKKWIVITSINDVTPAILRMATFTDYRIVIVCDSLSPATYYKSPNIVYLTLEMQYALGFSIVEKTPLRSYTRKNVGYLYAIMNGASVIYDTDDDNFIEESPRPRSIKMNELHPRGSSIALNPYAAFGRPEIWPRGFPLEELHYETIDRGSYRSNTFKHINNASIWQGLADLDPDVDAIFRLTRSDRLKRVIFPRKAPIYIPHGLFAPFNSQNTMFFAPAFWGLYLPKTVSFRLTDIWRGYFTQKLMQYLDQHVAFVGPTVSQTRNPHNYHDDYLEERQMYEQTAHLLRFLQAWNPPPTITRFFDIMLALATDMADAHFWSRDEIDVISLWINDLRTIHYPEPVLAASRVLAAGRIEVPLPLIVKQPLTLTAPDWPAASTSLLQAWETSNAWPAASIAIQMDTRGFGAYMYDILFSASYFLQQGKSIAYNVADHSAYDSGFCDGARGLLCFFEMKNTSYAENFLDICSMNTIHEKQFCTLLNRPSPYRGAIAGEAFVQVANVTIVPEALARQGWSPHQWFGFLAGKLTVPNAKMARVVESIKKKIKWDDECIAVHIRRSDKIIEYVDHTFPRVHAFLNEVGRILIEQPSIRAVFITSDSDDAVNEFIEAVAQLHPSVRVMVVRDQMRFNGRECGDNIHICTSRNHLKNETEREMWAVNSMVDFYLLSSCRYLVGSFSSFYTKIAAYRMISRMNDRFSEDTFRSIDNDDSLAVWSAHVTVEFPMERFIDVPK